MVTRAEVGTRGCCCPQGFLARTQQEGGDNSLLKGGRVTEEDAQVTGGVLRQVEGPDRVCARAERLVRSLL